MTTRRRYAFYAAATITAATLGGCALVAGLFEPRPLHCSNGLRDDKEEGVDCGGECPSCDGAKCASDDECTSQRCVSGKCSRPACLTNSTNAADTCSACHRCPVEEPCASNLDCLSGFCATGACAQCGKDLDCGTGNCVGTVCVAVTCNNGVKDNSEQGIDCGGDCPTACPDGGVGGAGGTGGTGTTTSSTGTGAMGGMGTGATGGMGTGGTSGGSCTDGAPNGTETDVDCGGTCPKCSDGLKCKANTDCASGVCNGGAQPTCMPAMKCSDDSDCTQSICVNEVCRAAGCSPTMYSAGCGAGQGVVCTSDTACWSGVCNITCQPPSCLDSVHNGAETDTDCGFAACVLKPCDAAQKCASDADCLSMSCDLTQTPHVCK